MGVEILIELQNYSFSYDRKTQILSNINLKINQGEFVVITGLSGCGKTTLTRVLNGLCPNFYQGEVWGKYELYGKNVEDMSSPGCSAVFWLTSILGRAKRLHPLLTTPGSTPSAWV